MKLKSLLLFCGILPQIIFAQIVGHQDITLPTPSISSSIANYDVEVNNLAYGMSSPSINLFTIEMGDVSVPITLSHSYNGYKPNELPGILGLGWTISGSGAVFKNIHGIDDDHSNGYPKTVNFFMPQCSTAAQLSNEVSYKLNADTVPLDHFKRLIAKGEWDGLPDKYIASAPGLHENFYQYKIGKYSTFPHSETTIDWGFVMGYFNGWVVTNGIGTKYVYGEANDYIDDNNLMWPTIGTNTWQLTEIKTANGESIEYNYGSTEHEERYQYRDAMRYGSKIGQTTILQQPLNAFHKASYESSLLESIKCSNYTLIYHYSLYSIIPVVGNTNINLPQLDSICIKDKENITFKTISFKYKEKYNSFLLEEVNIAGKNYEIIEKYQFFYNENMPGSYAYPSRNMDHWGYANGNTGKLYPKSGAIELQDGGDREANADESQFGLLITMRLPTDGTIIYEYEKNRIYLGKGYEEIDKSYSLIAKDTIGCNMITKNRVIRIPFDQEITLNYTCGTNGLPWECEGMGIKIRDVEENNYYIDINITEDKEVTTTIELEEGVYILEIYSADKNYEIRANITQKDCIKDEYSNCIEVDKFYDVGGHRIKRITQTPIYGSDIVSDINYHKSGILFGQPKYESSSVDHRYAYIEGMNWPHIQITGYWTTRIGNSLETLLRDGNPIMYKTVTVEKLANGKVIKSTYDYLEHSSYGQCANGSFYADIPGKRGQVLNQNVFTDGNSEPIRKIENIYKNKMPENEKAVIAIHQDFQIAGENPDETTYRIGSWCPVNDIKNVLDSTIITQDNITIKKTFTYNNNGLLESEQYLNSKGENINIQYTYSTAYRSKPVYIEQKVNGKIVSGKKIILNGYGQPIRISNYYDGIGYVKSKEVIYKSFYIEESAISKPVQQIDYGNGESKTSSMSQIWGYNAAYPIATSSNSTINESGHTSFENNELNGWTKKDHNYFSTNPEDAFTGKSSMVVPSGYGPIQDFTVGRNAENHSGYKASVWVKGKDAYLHIEVNGEWSTHVRVTNDFDDNKWYKLEVELPKSKIKPYFNLGDDLIISVYVGGANAKTFFDDIRFHPSDAQMTTYTHEPLIGVTSISDANNRPEYYIYDSFGRLEMVKDFEGNIIKKNDYHYRENN